MNEPQFQETQFFALLDALPLGSYVFRLEDRERADSLRIVFANRASESMLGLAPADVVGGLIGEHFPNSLGSGGPAEAYRQVVVEQRALDLGMLSYGDDRLPQSQFALSAFPAGVDMVLLLFDNLSTSAARVTELAAIVDSAEDAILSKSLRGKILTWNSAAERIYGYTAAEAVGQSISMLLPPDRPNEVAEILAQLAEGKRIECFETTRLHKDGTLIDVSLTVSPIKDLRGSVVGAATIARDIRPEKEAESHLQLLAAIVDASEDAILSRDLDRRILSWNPGAERIFGYRADEVLGQAIDLAAPDLTPELAEIREGLLRGEPQATHEMPMRRKDGSEVWISAAASPITDPSGRVVGVASVLRDVTTQRELEAQLRQAQKMEAIGNLAGGIAHDFNNLLLVIRGYTSILLARAEIGERHQEDLRKVDLAAERAADLTHQLLAFSRQQTLRPELIDVSAVADETLGLLRRLIGENINLEWELGADLPLILADRGQFGQVVMNLAVNARDAMPNGGTITIRSGTVEFDEGDAGEHANGTYVYLQLSDSGIGMDLAVQERAFDPFFTTKEDGTGLGLATVYGIVKQSGGHIWLSSEAGVGTTFEVYFPVAAQTAQTAAVVRDEPRVGSLLGDETILLVDDEDLVRGFVQAALESYGYTVLAAASGAEAVEILERLGDSIDLLLTDLVMPGMNGRELAEHVALRHPGLTVLFSSGYPPDVAARQDVVEARTNFIEKPYSPDELARTVRGLLQSS
jgi:two-component system cell cycle sensor histidine kinase/response regulator CckA